MSIVDQAIQREARAAERQYESELVAKVRDGDHAAVRILIDRHRLRLIRVAQNLLRDRMEAEDVSQDSFLKAFRELHRLRDDKAFSGFIYKICVRLCMDRLRSKRAEVADFEIIDTSQGSTVENRVLVERLLGQLNYELRTTLVLREMEELSYEEVAQVMGVPIGTVRSRLHSAREKFRKIYIEEMA